MKNLKVVFGLVLLSICLLSFIKKNKSVKQQNKSYELIVSDLTIPWGFTFLPTVL